MERVERSASSTNRRPSTPMQPEAVGRPPRRATRKSLSQRFSRLVMGQQTFLTNENISTAPIPDYTFTKAYLEEKSR